MIRRILFISIQAVIVWQEDDGVYEIVVAVISNQYIIGHGIEDVVNAIGEIFSIVFCVKTDTFKLCLDFFGSSFPRIYNKLLAKDSTNFTVSILLETDEIVGAIWKVLVMGRNSFKEWSKVVVRITEVVKFINVYSIIGHINLVLWTSVREHT